MKIFKKIWAKFREYKMILICLREGSDEIIAINVNLVRTKVSLFDPNLLEKVSKVQSVVLILLKFVFSIV